MRRPVENKYSGNIYDKMRSYYLDSVKIIYLAALMMITTNNTCMCCCSFSKREGNVMY